jgi:hypothetical protein
VTVRRKVAAGLAGVALLGGGGFAARSSQGGGSIDVFVGSTPTPVSGGSFPEGTFDCYGSTTNCTGLSPATCTTTIAATALQTTLNSASGGDVICMNTGTSSGVSLTSKTYSSVVTVQPVSGAAVTISGITLNAVAKLRFTGVGAASLSSTSMTVSGTDVDPSSGCSSNVTFDHLIYSGSTGNGAAFHGAYSCSHGLNILWDHDRFDNKPPGSCERCRFWLQEGNGGASANGVTISNSLFANGCADGIAMDGISTDPRGTVIGPGNEFTNLDQTYSDANCSGVHIDPIGVFYAPDTVVTGNYFHDNGSGSGGILDRVDPSMAVTNNVFASTGAATASILVKSADSNTYTHNVIAEGVSWPDEGDGSCVGGVIRNNVFLNSSGVSAPTCSPTADHNLGIDIAGTPTFVTSPATGYYHYVLAPSSPGYHAGSDGLSVGINP